jgi:hypothetical protein
MQKNKTKVVIEKPQLFIMHIAIVQGHPKHLVNPHNLELIQGNCM